MKNLLLAIIYFFAFLNSLNANFDREKITYALSNDPIDVVIPATNKDVETLNHCIDGIKQNCHRLRRVIVVSSQKLTDNAEWFSEDNYPFTKYDIALYLNRLDEYKALSSLSSQNSRVGWYYQQLLKFYSPFVIPEISSNILILDADTVFFKPVDFLSNDNGGHYATGAEFHQPYFQHAAKLLPGLTKLFPDKSGICHHMLFQKAILQDLFFQVEEIHELEFWKIFCLCVEPIDVKGSGASEYEIYFNFAFCRTDQVKLRPLKWMNSSDIHLINNHKNQGFHYVSYHSYLRQ